MTKKFMKATVLASIQAVAEHGQQQLFVRLLLIHDK